MKTWFTHQIFMMKLSIWNKTSNKVKNKFHIRNKNSSGDFACDCNEAIRYIMDHDSWSSWSHGHQGISETFFEQNIIVSTVLSVTTFARSLAKLPPNLITGRTRQQLACRKVLKVQFIGIKMAVLGFIDLKIANTTHRGRYTTSDCSSLSRPRIEGSGISNLW